MNNQRLSINLFGTFQATLGEETVPFRTDKIRALLAYFLLEAEQPHRRETLATLLWPDSPSSTARKNLRLSFFRMRGAIDKAANPPLADTFFHTSKQTIQLEPTEQLSVDVQLFRHHLAAVRSHGHEDFRRCPVCRESLQTAVSYYRGDLLTGFNLDDAEPFMEWLTVTRESLHQQALSAFDMLLENLQQYAQDETLRYARKLLQLEPWRESAHRTIMRTLALIDQRTAALDQFEKCRQVLWEELGVEPEPETVRLFEAIKAGELTSDGAGLRLHQAVLERNSPPPTNLTPPLTPFFGRQQETADLLRLLTDQNHRLVTLVGGGGIGKSRLSQEVGQTLLPQFSAGVWFVPLAGLEGGLDKTAASLEESIATAIADTLGYRFSGQGDPTSQILAYLRDKQMLLILDNFEHVIEGADLLVALLRGAPKLVLLTSSREPLNLMAETHFPLEGLETEGDDAPTQQLFVDRAQRTNIRFAITEENGPLIEQLCRLVAGGPLAIELAAAALRRQSLTEIIVAVQSALDRLTSRRRDLPARHRSLRAVFDSSWALLQPEEQEGLARLSVFRGRFAPEAAAEVANADAWLLETLAEKSLLRQTADSGFELHELLRQFAAEERRSLDISQELQTTHSHYYLNWLAGLEEPLQGETPQVPAAAIQQALDNILQAWRVALSERDLSILGTTVYALSHFLQLNGRYRQAVHLFGEAVAALEAPNLPPDQSQPLGRIQTQYGRNLVRLARYPEALAAARAAEQKAQLAQDAWGEIMSQLVQTDALWRQGNLEAARALLEPMIEGGGKTAVFPRLQGITFQYAGIIQELSEQYDAALSSLKFALKMWETLEDKQREAITLVSLGVVQIKIENLEQAKSLLESALKISNSLGDSQSQIHVLNNLSIVAGKQALFEEATEHLNQVLSLAQQNGSQSMQAHAFSNLGWIANLQNHTNRAKQHYLKALELFNKQGNLVGIDTMKQQIKELEMKNEQVSE